VKLVDTADLKSAAFLHKGRTGSIPVSGTKRTLPSNYSVRVLKKFQVGLRLIFFFHNLNQQHIGVYFGINSFERPHGLCLHEDILQAIHY